jgi:hypothetical protein
MRLAVVVFAALMTLGLVAFGVVVAQRTSDPIPLTAAATRVSSPQNTELAKSDKAPLDLGEAVKAAAFTSTAVAQNNTMRQSLPATIPTRSGSRESLRSIRQVALRSEPSTSSNMISYAIRKLL